MEKVTTELEMIESIYAEDGVVAEGAKESVKHHEGDDREQVECVLKLQPNTGFNMEKIAVIVLAKFTFKQEVTQ